MKDPQGSEKIQVTEIFSSLQGEGPCLGERHLFVRFPECNLRCDYCDEAKEPLDEFTAEEISQEIRRLEREHGPHSFVCFTGGEPLLYWREIERIASRLKPEGYRFYLETNGILCDALEKILGLMDEISMDMKLPSVTHDRACFEEHRRFLKLAAGKEVYVKIIVSRDIDRREFLQACDIVSGIDPGLLLVLQPVTAGDEKSIDGELLQILYQLQQQARARLEHVRIIPRLHKILEIR